MRRLVAYRLSSVIETQYYNIVVLLPEKVAPEAAQKSKHFVIVILKFLSVRSLIMRNVNATRMRLQHNYY